MASPIGINLKTRAALLNGIRVPNVSKAQDYIGPYRLLKLVRASKTAKIWEAMNSSDNKRLALKALHGDYCKDKAEIAALKHEYNVGKSIDHPNVIDIFEYDVVRGVPFIVMEYFNGPNVKQMIRQSPEVVNLHLDSALRACAESLGEMHEADWVHRDVKPDNFLMNEAGEIRLIDFSIAEKIKRGLSKLLSGKSKVQGTISYIPPEQIRGENVDGRADIYSLGCTYYEMVSGKMPYTGVNSNELLNKHLKAPIPSLMSVNEKVTKDFTRLVMRMMAKKAADRPASTEEVIAELEDIRVLTREKIKRQK